MLQRVPGIKKLFVDPSNEKHKRVIDEGVKAQTPLIEPLLPRIQPGYVLYNMVVTNKFALPLAPSLEFTAFSRSVANAWDSTTKDERRGLELPDQFLGLCSTSGFSLFSYNSKIKSSIRHLIDRAESVRAKMMIFEHLIQSRGSPGMKDELEKEGVSVDSISFKGDSVSYKLGRVKFTVSDISRELRETQSQLQGLAETMAKRLCFGFSPLF